MAPELGDVVVYGQLELWYEWFCAVGEVFPFLVFSDEVTDGSEKGWTSGGFLAWVDLSRHCDESGGGQNVIAECA